MTDRPCPAYEGNEPYFFVSYSHEDKDAVYPEMAWLHQMGFRLWYDDGIHVGTLWRRALAEALHTARAVIFMRTPRSVRSDYCLREINFALDEHQPVIVVELEPSDLPLELRFSLSERQQLRRDGLDVDSYRMRLADALQLALDEPAPAIESAPRPPEILHHLAPHGPRVALRAVVVAEPAQAEHPQARALAAALAAAGGDVRRTTAGRVEVCFGGAASTLRVLTSTAGIARAGVSCSDVTYSRDAAQGTAFDEAGVLADQAGSGEALLAQRFVDAAALQAGPTLLAPAQTSAGLPWSMSLAAV